ncbi:unnamed protein product, partial [Allacma fusca]
DPYPQFKDAKLWSPLLEERLKIFTLKFIGPETSATSQHAKETRTRQTRILKPTRYSPLQHV